MAKMGNTTKIALTLSAISIFLGIGYVSYKLIKKKVVKNKKTSKNIDKDIENELKTEDNIAVDKPNASCGMIHTDFDGDFNYVKCGDDWWTKNKENPFTQKYKNNPVYPEWHNLGNNGVAVDKLNKKYKD